MAKKAHLEILEKGCEAWNKWRDDNPKIVPDLSGAVLSFAHLANADLSGANLSGANLMHTELICARLANADLSGAFLWHANLVEADLSGADLSGADLRNANLVMTTLTEGNITGAYLYGTARDDWTIGDIKCDYIFWDLDQKNRVPKERDFESEEFEKLYKHLPTIEYVFEKGLTPIDAFLMDLVVHDINKKHPKFELRLDSFHSRVNPRAIFTIINKDYADEVQSQIKEKYEAQIKVLKAERDTLEDCFRMAIQKPHIAIKRLEMTRDKYHISGQAGAVGSHPHSHDMHFSQLSQMASEIDLAKLADELSQLRREMRNEADTPERDSSIGEIAAAEVAAKNAKGPQALEHLKKVGKRALELAEKIGTTVAASAIKASLGL
ncbi:MAG: pentapeptide repeat-containing protein [Desulfobacteraceae bacterium]|nr:MAG: pentapeptide repeat-containing protein [Desulfobacteraceae bacterium]